MHILQSLIVQVLDNGATYYGGSGDDYGLSVAKDALGRIYMAGTTNSVSNIASIDAYQPAIGGANDIYMARFY
jgi:hypothetical protein